MSDRFEDVNLDRISMISFGDCEIRVVFKDRQEAVFTFPTKEEMNAAIDYWSASRARREKPK